MEHTGEFGNAATSLDAMRAQLERRGFEVVSDLGAGELAGKYLLRSDGSLDGEPTPYWRVLHAVVRE